MIALTQPSVAPAWAHRSSCERCTSSGLTTIADAPAKLCCETVDVYQQIAQKWTITMMDTETAHLLATYNAWADQTLFAAVAKLAESDVYRQTRTLFGSIVGTLNHNYQVDLIWQAHLLGKKHGFFHAARFTPPKAGGSAAGTNTVKQLAHRLGVRANIDESA